MAQPNIYLEPDKYYHIYNRGNAGDKLFYSEDNYNYFLEKYFQYIQPIADTLCFCLMPNHFHFLIRIKSLDVIKTHYFEKYKTNNQVEIGVNTYNHFISKQFSNLFNGYSHAINKQRSRYGSLFSRAFKRKEVNSEEYLKNVILYIHLNPVKHGYSGLLTDWKHSSYNLILSQSSRKINSEEIIKLFGDSNNFEQTHKLKNLNHLLEADMESE
jgi:putative transposase